MAFTHFIVGGIAGVASGIFKPAERIIGMAMNNRFPTELPGFEMVLNAYWKGVTNYAGLQQLARLSGYYIPDEQGTTVRDVWFDIIKATRPIPSPTECRDLGWLGVIPEDEAARYLQQHFWGNVVYSANFYFMDEPFKLQELLVFYNRGLLTYDQTRSSLDKIGLHSEFAKDVVFNLADEIPGPSDIVHFVLRHGFEPSVIKANRLDEEFPEDAKTWLGKLGLSYEFTITDPFTGQKANTTWADMYWQTHWVPISPGQAYTMLQRLRPSRIKDVQTLVPGATVFTLDDVKRWLRINDYPPGIRDNLVAISYAPMQTRKVANLYEAGIIKQADVAEYFQDTGLSKRDSDRLAMLAKVQASDKKRKLLRENNLAHIKQAYIVGAASYQHARDLLITLVLSPTVYYDDLKAGRPIPPDVQQDVELIVLGTLSDWDLEIQLDRLKRFVAALHKAYTRGIVNRTGAIDQMTRWGIDQRRQADYLAEWDVDLMASAKEVSKGEIIKWYRDSIISLDDAIFRLRNLKYRDSDIAPILGEVQRSILLDLAKARMASAKTAEKKAKALIAYQKALVRAHRDARSELSRHGTVADIGKWFKREILDERTARNRLAALDWPKLDIDHQIDEWNLELKPKPAKPPKPARPHAKPKVSVATLAKWWKLGIIQEDEWTARMKALEYDDDDIKRYEQEFELPPLPKGAVAPT